MSNYLIVEADTPELREICYRLRYQVYCVENAYEDPAQNIAGLETDSYDEVSAHALVIHRPTGMAAGTVRLILPSGDLDPPLPYLAATGSDSEIGFASTPLAQAAEISRFAISKEFRRRANAHVRGQSSLDDETSARRTRITGGIADLITLALVRAFLQLAAKRDVHYLYALMERGLLRRAEKLGLHFQITGSPVAYHGWRQPTRTNVLALLDRAKQERNDVWDAITSKGDLLAAFSRPLAAE